ncbi:MAG: formyltetrahydrofolate deformylase [Actinomycetota bacterium]
MTWRLLITCPDRSGIVMAVTSLLFEHAANIVDAQQHTTDAGDGTFFMRLEYTIAGPEEQRALEESFAGTVAGPFGMEYRFAAADARKRVAILVSREDHCLLDLLWRWRRGELPVDVVRVISNHPDLGDDVEAFGVPFSHVPVAKDAREEAEERILRLVHGEVDLVVLARYMQILTGAFIEEIGTPIINIHHSFLPAFVGADPYRRAFDRGVKIIGATAHYVTEELDGGPIIEQDVERVSHRHEPNDLVLIGRDVERVVLARAVAWHADDRVIVHEGKTVVFQ